MTAPAGWGSRENVRERNARSVTKMFCGRKPSRAMVPGWGVASCAVGVGVHGKGEIDNDVAFFVGQMTSLDR
jgi:hypothetical protein